MCFRIDLTKNRVYFALVAPLAGNSFICV